MCCYNMSHCSEHSPFSWLPQSAILIRTHFHSNTLQNLFNPHIAIPVSHCWHFVRLDYSSPRVHTIHIDFGDESNFRWYSWVVIRAMNPKLIETAIVLRLKGNDENSDKKHDEAQCYVRMLSRLATIRHRSLYEHPRTKKLTPAGPNIPPFQ